jgi:crotonobetainyl-CoA:carnitine CoA-transferase CaiB-like acyl-CoA transferase
MPGPLYGIRVVDLTRALAGPVCTQILADLGAEVIKIERPGVGDESRHWGPPWVKDTDGNDIGESAYYASANRGKHSLTVDIGHPEGQAIVKRLVERADVFVENFKTDALAAKGLDYPTLSRLNPRLVYCSITAFGQTGPRRHEPGYDYVIQGLTGMMSMTGASEGEPGGDPQRAGVAIADLSTGLHAAIAILASLRHRDQSGEGQYLDAALFDTTLSLLAGAATGYLLSGRCPTRTGSPHGSLAPDQHFRTGGGRLIIAALNDDQFNRLVTVLGRASLREDPRFRTNRDRIAHRAALEQELEHALSSRDATDWAALLREADVPCGPINTIAEALEDPQVEARHLRVELQRPTTGSIPGIAYPVRFSKTPAVYAKAPPLLGEDTESLLTQVLGLDGPTIDSLRSRGII